MLIHPSLRRKNLQNGAYALCEERAEETIE